MQPIPAPGSLSIPATWYTETATPNLKRIKIEDVKLDDKNANLGTPKGRAFIEGSLKKYGIGRSILLDKDGTVIAGNKTLEAFRAAGGKEIIVVGTQGDALIAVQREDINIDSKKGRSLAIADNRASEIDLKWNPEAIASFDLDLGELFDEKSLRSFGIEKPIEAPEPQLDKADELQKKWKTARGQIWEIGEHRLMCGDSGEAQEVLNLFGDRKAQLMATDPPYGVGYGIESGPDSAKRFGAMGSDEADGPKLQEFLEGVFLASLAVLVPGAPWYLWHAQMTQGFFAAAAAAQFRIHRQIIWVKSHFILGHGDFHWQHELCFYGWREGEKHRWFGGRDQSTLWAIDNPRAHDMHPTEKPPEIFGRAMRLSTEPGDLCYEPFSGSGSQLCAAHSLGRRCYGMEIEPKYVAVALERMSDMGLTPKLIKA